MAGAGRVARGFQILSGGAVTKFKMVNVFDGADNDLNGSGRDGGCIEIR